MSTVHSTCCSTLYTVNDITQDHGQTLGDGDDEQCGAGAVVQLVLELLEYDAERLGSNANHQHVDDEGACEHDEVVL